jgi:hypothetical protein
MEKTPKDRGKKREIERTVRKTEILRGMGDKRDITTISTEERDEDEDKRERKIGREAKKRKNSEGRR